MSIDKIDMNPMTQKGSTQDVGSCPKCGTHLLYEPNTRYCRWCGCKLEWDSNKKPADKVIIVMLGAPCSGKSTVGKVLSCNLGIDYVSSGDIARSMGDEVNEELKAGHLAPEEEMRNKIAELIMNKNSFILDGFPRFNDQFNFLLRQISLSGHDLMFVMLDSTISDLVYRNSSRFRDDHTNFSERIKWYIDNTMPMIENIQYRYKDDMIISKSSSMVDIYYNVSAKYRKKMRGM